MIGRNFRGRVILLDTFFKNNFGKLIFIVEVSRVVGRSRRELEGERLVRVFPLNHLVNIHTQKLSVNLNFTNPTEETVIPQR